MKRTTIYLPEELKARLEQEAARRGVTEAEVIRQAVDRELHRSTLRSGFLVGDDPLRGADLTRAQRSTWLEGFAGS
jgi:hypothetical protein